MRGVKGWATGVALAGALLLPCVAQASVFYGVGSKGSDGSSDVYIVTNITSGTAVKIGETGYSLTDTAWQSSTRQLYAVDFYYLYKIDLSTGKAAIVGATGYKLNALEFCGDTLYGWGDQNLVTVNVSTGKATLVGTTSGFLTSGDMACAPDGTLYGTALSSPYDKLVKLNRTTGAATLLGTMNYPYVYGLDFDVDGTLYGASNQATVTFFTVDKLTGQTLKLLGTLTGAIGMYGFSIETDDGTGCTLTQTPDKYFYLDEDADSYGTDSDDPSDEIKACLQPEGYSANALDCNDMDPLTHPGAVEYCDGLDNDCNGLIDDGTGQGSIWYADKDGDGYGGDTTVTACTQPPGYVATNGDCNDNNAAIHPGALEVCNDRDDDCNGKVDDGVPTTTYHQDADGDGYGNPQPVYSSCYGPVAGYTADKTDCNDQDSSVHPGAAEVCDAADNDCDGQVDEDGDTVFYRDADGDGWGSEDSSQTLEGCVAPEGYAGRSGDCDDSDPLAYPGATEICDGVDNDCNGAVDDVATGGTAYYPDADGDSYGANVTATWACQAPTGYVSRSGDCDDTNAAVHPDADEISDGIDNDCDGQVDEDLTPPPGDDDDATGGDDDATGGDDDATGGDDDATGGDDDATNGDDDATGGDDDATGGDDDATNGDDDATAGGDDDATHGGGDDDMTLDPGGDLASGCDCDQAGARTPVSLGSAWFALLPLGLALRLRRSRR